MNNRKVYWTKERCHEEALKFNSRGDFQKKSRSAYLTSYKKGWLNDVCSHMIGIYKPDGYWNYENIKEEALMFTNRSDFKNGSKAYAAAKQNGYLDDVCSHMKLQGGLYKRFVYKASFDDGSIYIGLTYNLDKRIYDHLTRAKSSVYKHIILTGKRPIFELIGNELLSKEDAVNTECKYIEEYKNLGFNILNKVKGGGLGGSIIIWTLDKVSEEALKFKNRSDFQKKSVSAYCAAHRNGWLDDVCSHMTSLIKNWTIINVKEEALKFKNRSGFQKGSNGAYCAAHRNGWLDDVCSHMVSRSRKKVNIL
jgi:predicted GIY-YIG superfamily endonuclease